MIHATELMIGDWVFIKVESHKVSYLAPFDIGDARLAVISNDYDGNPYLYFEPILLTPEILEKNGFSLERDGAYTYYDDVHIPEQQYIAVLFRHNLTVRHIEIATTALFGCVGSTLTECQQEKAIAHTTASLSVLKGVNGNLKIQIGNTKKRTKCYKLRT